jgi:succinoglycan biosynthesis transport protein ExoP
MSEIKRLPAFAADLNARQQPLILPPDFQYGAYLDDASTLGHLSAYWRLFRRWKWILILSAVSGIALGFLPTLFLAPLYQAKASLEIQDLNDNFLNMKQVLPVNDSGGQANTYGDVQTQIKILQSDSVLGLVAAKMFAVEAQDRERVRPINVWSRLLLGPAPSPEVYVQAETKRLSHSLKVRAVGQTRIVELTADSTNPRLAADFLNQLNAEYIDQNVKSRWETSQRTSQSLARLLEDAQAKLRQSELALQSYAQTSGLMITSDKKNVAEEKLSQLQEELSKADASLVEAQSRYEVAKTSQVPEGSPAGGGVDSEADFDIQSQGSIRGYQDKLADLRRQRAELATTYTSDYGKVKRLDAQINSLQATVSEEKRNSIRRAKNEYRQAKRRESLLAISYLRQSAEVSDMGKRAVQYNILERELDGNRHVYDEMLKQVKEATLVAAIPSSNVRVLDRAVPPEKPDSPKLLLNCALGLLTGLSAGMLLVFVRERSDDSMREPGDGLHYVGLQELGVVLQDRHGSGLLSSPHRKALPRTPITIGAAIESENSAVKDHAEYLQSLWPKMRELHPSLGFDSLLVVESCRAVVTSLLLSGVNGAVPHSVAVTSPGPGEGKTTVVANMGLILALIGRRVLVVDGDLRRPRLHQLFSLDVNCGLSTLLQQGEISQQALDTVVQETAVPELSVLTSGPSSVSSANLLYSREFPELLQKLKKEYEFVLIDTPPVLQVADARVIGRFADGIILVVRAGQTARNAAAAAHERLDADRANVVGLILNDWDPSSSSHSYYSEYARSYSKTA